MLPGLPPGSVVAWNDAPDRQLPLTVRLVEQAVGRSGAVYAGLFIRARLIKPLWISFWTWLRHNSLLRPGPYRVSN